jgi:hypothetical protein
MTSVSPSSSPSSVGFELGVHEVVVVIVGLVAIFKRLSFLAASTAFMWRTIRRVSLVGSSFQVAVVAGDVDAASEWG